MLVNIKREYRVLYFRPSLYFSSFMTCLTRSRR